jgi:anti-sigma regulatory factor (Ser/Thr protein kinase)
LKKTKLALAEINSFNGTLNNFKIKLPNVNLYSRKQLWKRWLFITALFIVGVSLWYTNTLVHQIEQTERKNVKLWADAVQKKALLVKYTNDLFDKLKAQERKKVELWADATKELSKDLSDYSFALKVVSDNTTVPVILADENRNPIASRNLNPAKENDTQYLKQQMQEMQKMQTPLEINVYKGKKNYLYYQDSKLFSELKLILDDLIKSFISEVAVNSVSVPVVYTDSSKQQIIATGNLDSSIVNNPDLLKITLLEMQQQNKPIEVEFDNTGKHYIFYQESKLLTRIKYFPYVMLSTISLFLLIAYFLFSTARKAEQNQVWVGMAKETAHQLGTPLSSLIAWVEYLKTKNLDAETAAEINKDLKRLETITERFSKIGATPQLENTSVIKALYDATNYIKQRVSKQVSIHINNPDSQQIITKLNIPLFEWAIENICRNAVDAMDGKGSITINVLETQSEITIDITDTGKGIAKTNYKTIFEPGFTTKERGWGLGLSLTKRIIENYHQGKIVVLQSEINKGTTFRITLNK